MKKWGELVFNNMRIGKRLTLFFVVVAIVASISGFIGAYFLYRTNEQYSNALKYYNTTLADLYFLSNEFFNIRLNMRDVILLEDLDLKQNALDKISEHSSKIGLYINKIELELQTKEEQELFNILKQNNEDYKNVRARSSYLALQNTKEMRIEADKLMRTEGAPKAEICFQTVEKLVRLNLANTEAKSLELDAQALTTMTLMLCLIATSLVTSVFIALYAAKSLNRPLKLVENAAVRISKGDAEFELKVDTDDEIGLVAKVFNTHVKAAFNEIKYKNKTIMDSLAYARKIQGNILPDKSYFDRVFNDYHILWYPRDQVGGDFYWIESFDKGTVLFVGDCTGHGTPGALLTMLCVSLLNSVVTNENCGELDKVIWECDQKFSSVIKNNNDSSSEINDGIDFAIFFIDNNKEIKYAAKNMKLFICDGDDIKVIKGQRTRAGISNFSKKDEIEIHEISYEKDSKFFVASDGLFDQIGEETHLPFGYSIFKKIILQNHNNNISKISDLIWDEFSRHMGNQQRRDDVTLIGFKI